MTYFVNATMNSHPAQQLKNFPVLLPGRSQYYNNLELDKGFKVVILPEQHNLSKQEYMLSNFIGQPKDPYNGMYKK